MVTGCPSASIPAAQTAGSPPDRPVHVDSSVSGSDSNARSGTRPGRVCSTRTSGTRHIGQIPAASVNSLTPSRPTVDASTRTPHRSAWTVIAGRSSRVITVVYGVADQIGGRRRSTCTEPTRRAVRRHVYLIRHAARSTGRTGSSATRYRTACAPSHTSATRAAAARQLVPQIDAAPLRGTPAGGCRCRQARNRTHRDTSIPRDR